MSIFKKKAKALPLPEGFSKNDIRIESSICTGEKTIGFYDEEKGVLRFSELVRTDEDIDSFYGKYGLERNGG